MKTRILLPLLIILQASYMSAQYCEASGPECNTPANSFISNVTFGTVDNTSECADGTPSNFGYSDFTSMSSNIYIGSSYTINVTPGSPFFGDACAIYIDWNQDKTFDESTGSNEVLTILGNPGGPYSSTITVPAGALIGTTRLRIRTTDASADLPAACGTTSYGEVEDYTILVIDTTGGATNPEVISVNDSIETDKEVAVNIAVLVNDTVRETQFDTSSLVVVSVSTNGEAVVQNDGTITYTPNQGFVGSDQFTYTIDDTAGRKSNEATVKITVNAPAGIFVKSNDNILDVYPNPAQNYIQLNLKVPVRQYKVEISNYTGQLMYSKEHQAMDAEKISLEEWPTGLYNITIYSDQLNSTRVFVIN